MSLDVNQDRNIAKFNNQRFYYDIYFQDCQTLSAEDMKTVEGRFKNAVKISPVSVHKLVIEDDIMSWFHKGYLIFQNNFAALEGADTEDGKLPIVRNDGRDLLMVRIEPLGDGGQPDDPKFKREDWSLEFEFVIYDIEDMPHSNPSIKFKKLYFWDLRYQLLSEMKIEFSTIEIAERQPIEKKDVVIQESDFLDNDLEKYKKLLLSLTNIIGFFATGNIAGAIAALVNIDNTTKTLDSGDIKTNLSKIITDIRTGSILELLKDVTNVTKDLNALVNPTNPPPAVLPAQNNLVSNNGEAFTGDAIAALIVKATADFNLGRISEEYWDKGKTTIFYTAPVTYSALDSLQYLLDNHVAEQDADQCLFTNHRYTKEFQLIPYAKLFENSTNKDQKGPGKYQFEHFYLERFAKINESSTIVPTIAKAPSD
ncbi:MAG: hypothetical protein ABIO05_08870, partial [Ferruginibacter sp.]